MNKQVKSRKEIARDRIKGLLVFLIFILSLVLFYDVYLLFKGWL